MAVGEGREGGGGVESCKSGERSAEVGEKEGEKGGEGGLGTGFGEEGEIEKEGSGLIRY